MSSQPTRLFRVDTHQSVVASLEDDLSADDLLDAEAVWSLERIRIARRLMAGGAPPEDIPQSLHWNWAIKAVGLGPAAFGALSPIRVFGVRTDQHWEGILLAVCVGHPSRTGKSGLEQIYVEFIEIAPWN